MMDQIAQYKVEREKMVRTQLQRRGITDERVLEVFRTVPRHLFVPDEAIADAYRDQALYIGYGQTISQPYIVALMTSLLSLQGDERVLEIGTGSGYQAAVLARLSKEVHTIERDIRLASQARLKLDELEIENVHIHHGDGSLGWSAAAPYQAILITAAAPKPPQPIINQLADNGRLVLPVGSRRGQELQCLQRKGQEIITEKILPVAFVPLWGAYGWKENEWEDSSEQ